MFADVRGTETAISIRFSKLDKVWNVNSKDLMLPRIHIESIESGPDLINQIRGLRWPGTSGFGIRAGIFRQRNSVRHFWNIRKRYADHTIRFNLINHKFKSVVVQVEDPQTVLGILKPLVA